MSRLKILEDISFMRIDFGLMPELENARGFPGGPNHAEDVLTHLLLAAANIDREKPLLRLAALLHDIGKPFCHKDGRFRGHEKAGAEMAENILKRLDFPDSEIRYVKSLVEIHMVNVFKIRIGKLAVKLSGLLESGASVSDFAALRKADRLANLKKGNRRTSMSDFVSACEKALLWKPPLPKRILAVSGHDVMRILNIPEGPLVGMALKKLENMVAGGFSNTRNELLKEIGRLELP